MGTTPVVETAWRFYELFRLTGEVLAFVALFIGAVGYYFTSKNANQHRRYRAMFLGGGAALLALLLLNSMYRALSWGVSGTTSDSDPLSVFMPYAIRNWHWIQPGDNSIYPVIATIAPVCGILGLSGIAIGSGMWAIGKVGGKTRLYGRKAFYFGLGSMVVSVGGRMFSAIVYVLAPGF